jgi:hypothetical protein
MTKKEQREFENLQGELIKARAFRFTDKVEPDVPIPQWPGLVKGWIGVGPTSNHPRVEKACSSSVSHNIGGWEKTTTQQAKRLYSSELLAWKALRYEVEQECASKLARIDEQISALSEKQDEPCSICRRPIIDGKWHDHPCE